MAVLYRERHLCDEVAFDWDEASGMISRDELIVRLQNDMLEAIDQLKSLSDSKEREIELKRIEFLRVSIVRARLGREMISLAFPRG